MIWYNKPANNTQIPKYIHNYIYIYIAIITTINRTAIITTINRIAIITTIDKIAIITTINRIAIITTINRIPGRGRRAAHPDDGAAAGPALYYTIIYCIVTYTIMSHNIMYCIMI